MIDNGKSQTSPYNRVYCRGSSFDFRDFFPNLTEERFLLLNKQLWNLVASVLNVTEINTEL